MTRKRFPLFMALGCGLTGCAATRNDSGLSLADPHPTQPEPAPFRYEVRELRDDDASLQRRIEGMVDGDGNFVAHGLTTNFWSTEEKKSEYSYVNGVKHGPFTSWYRGGQLWSTGQYEEGRDDGIRTVWFPNGRKAQEFHFNRGAWHGLYSEWHFNGPYV